MRVGTITFQYAFNYGAVLQCLALQRALKGLGVETEVVNYFPPAERTVPWWRGWGILYGRFLETSFRRGVDFIYGPRMRREFDEFRGEYLSFSKDCTDDSVQSTTMGYDALIVGSDQVWNHPKSSVYFLEWSPEYQGRRISYAASFGQARQLAEDAGDYGKWLRGFDALSVRDELSRQLVGRFSGLDAEVVADPTFLVDLDDVKRDVFLPFDEYLLVYVLGDEVVGGHRAMVDLLRKELGDIPVVAVISSAHKPHHCPWADIKVWRAGPREWLSLVSKAQFVYTDSFHGAVFAMKYHKPFVAYYSEEVRAPRLMDLSERYGIQRNVIGSVDEALENRIGCDVPDYDHIDRLISDHVERSYAFLRNGLGLGGGA
jgi:Polysaccharide pyruvyl transferase